MKKIIRLMAFYFAVVMLLTSCDASWSNESSDANTNNPPSEIISLNEINWDEYCVVKPYFLGVEDNKIVTSCWLEIDDNYEIYSEVFVRVRVTFDVFYYTNLTGGDETHLNMTFYYHGFLSDHLEELTWENPWPYEVTKDRYSNGKPEIEVVEIFGKICR